MSRRRYFRQTDDDGAPLKPEVTPEQDFIDRRPGVAPGATAWDVAPKRDLEAVEDVLDDVLGRFAGRGRSTIIEIVDRWQEIAGPDWAGTIPAAVEGDTLVVDVPDGTAASRLQFDALRVVRRLGAVGGGGIRKVRFRVVRR